MEVARSTAYKCVMGELVDFEQNPKPRETPREPAKRSRGLQNIRHKGHEPEIHRDWNLFKRNRFRPLLIGLLGVVEYPFEQRTHCGTY